MLAALLLRGTQLQSSQLTQAVALVAKHVFTRDYLGQGLRELGGSFTVHEYLVNDDIFDEISQADQYALIVVECDWSDDTESFVELIKKIGDAQPSAPIAVVSGTDDPNAIICALNNGVRGYIPTTLELPVTISALRLVLSGGVYAPVLPFILNRTCAPPANPTDRPFEAMAVPVSHRLAAESHQSQTERLAEFRLKAVKQFGLTAREAEILLYLYKGKQNNQIATELGISPNTVTVHIRHLMKKLNATNRTQAVFHAIHQLDERYFAFSSEMLDLEVGERCSR